MARAASRRSDVRSGKVTPLWSGPETLSLGWWNFGLSVASDGKTCAMLRETFSDPPEVWAGPIGAWKQITTSHHAERRELGKGREHPLDE